MEKEQDIIVNNKDLETSRRQEKFDLIPILDKLRSASNVGNIFRLTEALHLKEIITCGYTATPPHPKLAKTSRGADEAVDFRHFETAADAARELKSQGYTILGIETVEGAKNLFDYKFEPKTAVILGNEALGISEEALELCDCFIQLELFGKKNSINVSNCASAVLFKAIEDIK